MVEEAKRFWASEDALPVALLPTLGDVAETVHDAYDATSAEAFIKGRPPKNPKRPGAVRLSRAERKQLRREAKRKRKLERRARWQAKKEERPSYYAFYVAYINSAEWRAFRLLVFSLRGKRCERCGAEEPAPRHLHHLTYRNLGHEEQEDVMVLCRDCHRAAHPEKSKAA